MKELNVDHLISCLNKVSFKLHGNKKNKIITNLNTPDAADEHSLIWIANWRNDKEEIIATTRAKVIVCDPHVKIDLFPDKFFIVTENPKLVFSRIGNTFFKEPQTNLGIHPTAIIHPSAKIAKSVSIGPYSYVGNCVIEENVIIHNNCHVYDHVELGKGVVINSGCKIGAIGFGHTFNEMDELENFPQIGKVSIKEDVELGVNTIVYRGALTVTQIGRNTKIDGNVIVGHNVVIGENTLIAANSVVGGSSKIGNRVFIGINVTLIDYINIDDEAHIGAGAVVIENIRKKTRVVVRPPVILPVG